MSKELARLYASKFIQRKDVKAVQLDRDGGGLRTGDWFPDTRIRRDHSSHLPTGWTMDHLLAHLEGTRTYGHYLLDEENNCKLFAFDIDLKTEGTYVKVPDWTEMPDFNGNTVEEDAWIEDQVVVTDDVNPLELWHTRKKSALEARNWYKYQMKHLAYIIASSIEQMGFGTAVAYSGNKGIHVYGFTGTMPAVEVREAAMIALDMSGEFEPVRGKNFYRHKNEDPVHGFSNFSIEIFPKQTSLEGKQMGNLMRLPLGVNHKNPADPTFFLDMTTPLSQFTPHSDPVKLLSGGSVFE